MSVPPAETIYFPQLYDVALRGEQVTVGFAIERMNAFGAPSLSASWRQEDGLRNQHGLRETRSVRISTEQVRQLQSESCAIARYGVGAPLSEPETRAMNVAARQRPGEGMSGVRPRVLRALPDAKRQGASR